MRLVICGRDQLAAEAMTNGELEGVRSTLVHFRSTELVPRLLATIEALLNDEVQRIVQGGWARIDDVIQRNEQALNVALEFGWIDGDHHKAWVIDQMVRALTGGKYPDFVGEDWDEGIAP